MSVDNNRFHDGVRMQLWKCEDGSGQKFLFDSNSGRPSLLRVAAHSEYCVVINWNKDKNGAFAQLWHCDPNLEGAHWVPQWDGDSMMLRNAAWHDKCLVVDNNKGKDGQKMQLWSCVDPKKQSWKQTDA